MKCTNRARRLGTLPFCRLVLACLMVFIVVAVEPRWSSRVRRGALKTGLENRGRSKPE